MPVDSQHEQYVKLLPLWQRCNDAVEGQHAIHSAGKVYLPALKDQTYDDYDAYKLRATYFNAVGRTLDGLVGMIFRKAPVIDVPSSMQSIIDDIDLAGTSLDGLAEKITRKVLDNSRIGVLVEYPVVKAQPKNQAEASSQNLRPYVTTYEAKTIINWRIARVNNVSQPVMIALTETYTVSDDGFDAECAEQIRVLSLEPEGYIQRVYRKENTSKKWVKFDEIIPIMNGARLKSIPFYVFGASSNSFDEQMPMLLDLVDLCLSHYRVTADYEHGCHFAGLPTAVITGHTAAENEKLYIGSAAAWVFAAEGADAKFLEFTGQGLGALENNLERKEKQMSVLGARILEQQKNGVEAAEAMKMRANGEGSVLAGVANLESDQLSNMLNMMALWEGVSYECSIKLNTDYMANGMTPQELAEKVKTWQAGGMSFETLYYNLQRGELHPEGLTIEDEKELIANAMPILSTDNGDS